MTHPILVASKPKIAWGNKVHQNPARSRGTITLIPCGHCISTCERVVRPSHFLSQIFKAANARSCPTAIEWVMPDLKTTPGLGGHFLPKFHRDIGKRGVKKVCTASEK